MFGRVVQVCMITYNCALLKWFVYCQLWSINKVIRIVRVGFQLSRIYQVWSKSVGRHVLMLLAFSFLFLSSVPAQSHAGDLMSSIFRPPSSGGPVCECNCNCPALICPAYQIAAPSSSAATETSHLSTIMAILILLCNLPPLTSV